MKPVMNYALETLEWASSIGCSPALWRMGRIEEEEAAAMQWLLPQRNCILFLGMPVVFTESKSELRIVTAEGLVV